MRPAPILMATLLALTALAFIPSAEAVGTCTFEDPRCPGLACVGYSWSWGDRYYTCQYQIGKRPGPCTTWCPK